MSSPAPCANPYCRDGWIERGDNESGAAPAMPCRVCNPTDPLPSDLDEQRRKRFTRRQIEDHLARELVHWLPGGEGGGNPEQRASAAQAAAKIITERAAMSPDPLPGRSRPRWVCRAIGHRYRDPFFGHVIHAYFPSCAGSRGKLIGICGCGHEWREQ